MTEQSSNLPLGTKLWIGLWAYVFAADTYAVASGNGSETLSQALSKALDHPRKRWMVILAWALTTKHLLFRNILRWIDPFLGVGLLGSKLLMWCSTLRRSKYLEN